MSADDLRAILEKQLTRTLQRTELPGLGACQPGKVRDSYVDDSGKRIIVVSDRISAFDRVLGTIPFKGQVLNQIAQYWFEETREIAPNHLISVPDVQAMVVKDCDPLPVEFVMRGYLTGVTSTSIWRAYERGDRVFCGHPLADGMVKNQRLPAPLLTPSTKAEEGGHDRSVSRDELIASGAISAEDFETARDMVERLFAFGQERAAERGLVLVDTKYELGRTKTGEIIVIDEIHTPDSSRYWYRDSLEERVAAGKEPVSLDKEYVRRWLAETHDYRGDGDPPPLPDEVRVEAAARYIQTYELVTGREFVPDLEEPNERLARHLGATQ